MATSYSVPGVYYEPRPRAVARATPRTDVVGFVGFEPRVLDGTTPTQLIGSPPTGHAFQVNVNQFQLPRELLGVRATVPPATDLRLSSDSTSIPVGSGGSIRYALAAALEDDGTVRLLVVAGPASTIGEAASASDDDITTAASGRAWVRIADIQVRRSDDGAEVSPSILPTLPATRCDDWRDFALQIGPIPAVDDGTLLARAVRAYFANGGSRCYVATIRRPRFDDPLGMAAAIEDLVGIPGSGETEATGVEKLLRIFEVAIIDVPDLYARHVDSTLRQITLPPLDRNACFRSCADTLTAPGSVIAAGEYSAAEPLFDDGAVLAAQRAMLVRCGPERWRVLLLLTAPVATDVTTGLFRGPDADRSITWRRQLDGALDDLSVSVGAFYHPWVMTQERLGAPIVELPPTALAAGILARRDLARGPHVAPANEGVIGAVGLSPAVDDSINALIYETPLNINAFRSFPGLGVQVWGARTLSSDHWMRYVSVRRCLSAIERKALVALRPLVFEPNTPTLWFQITQALLGILVPIYNAGALRGSTPEQSYYVRCDAGNNPPEAIAAGQVLCEVGVAIAAPAEFIVFRVGRREGVIEVLE
jgi:phage tail sheath protein FI